MHAYLIVGLMIALSGLWVSAKQQPVEHLYEPGDHARVQQRLYGIEGNDSGEAEFRARHS
jgi:hypothetical protein